VLPITRLSWDLIPRFFPVKRQTVGSVLAFHTFPVETSGSGPEFVTVFRIGCAGRKDDVGMVTVER
jgi:hypothetical protein